MYTMTAAHRWRKVNIVFLYYHHHYYYYHYIFGRPRGDGTMAAVIHNVICYENKLLLLFRGTETEDRMG